MRTTRRSERSSPNHATRHPTASTAAIEVMPTKK